MRVAPLCSRCLCHRFVWANRATTILAALHRAFSCFRYACPSTSRLRCATATVGSKALWHSRLGACNISESNSASTPGPVESDGPDPRALGKQAHLRLRKNARSVCQVEREMLMSSFTYSICFKQGERVKRMDGECTVFWYCFLVVVSYHPSVCSPRAPHHP